MAITLTAAATQQIRTQLAKRGSGIGLRLGVKITGCSGLAYTYEYADALRDGDQVFGEAGATLVVDAASLATMDGARLDYVSQGMKQTFQFDNPNVGSTCGCGESFNLKAGGTPGASA